MSITVKNKVSTIVDDLLKTSTLTQAERDEIQLKMELVSLLDDAWNYKAVTQKQVTEACSLKTYLMQIQATPQIDILVNILKQLGYTLAIVPDPRIH